MITFRILLELQFLWSKIFTLAKSQRFDMKLLFNILKFWIFPKTKNKKTFVLLKKTTSFGHKKCMS